MAQWWVVTVPVVRTGRKLLEYVEGTHQQAQNVDPGATVVAGPYPSKDAAEKRNPQGTHGSAKSSSGPIVVNATPGKRLDLNPLSWITGLGGDIASGIEGGVVALLKDLWTVIEGPMLVLIGVVIAVVVLIVFFKNDLMQIGTSIGALAAMGAA